MNRRHFLKAASGLFVAASAGLAVPERKIWALDQSMVRPTGGVIHDALDWDVVQFMYQQQMISRSEAAILIGYDLVEVPFMRRIQ